MLPSFSSLYDQHSTLIAKLGIGAKQSSQNYISPLLSSQPIPISPLLSSQPIPISPIGRLSPLLNVSVASMSEDNNASNSKIHEELFPIPETITPGVLLPYSTHHTVQKLKKREKKETKEKK